MGEAEGLDVEVVESRVQEVGAEHSDYYADHYVHFKSLIHKLYRIYKTRIWLSVVEPASFSQHVVSQPLNVIGPGVVTMDNNLKDSNTMVYDADPDPNGAVRPYSIDHDTYTSTYSGRSTYFGGQAGGQCLDPKRQILSSTSCCIC